MAIVADPLFEQVLVIGEGRPYLAALTALNPDAFEDLAAELQLDPEDPAALQDPVLREILKARATRQLDAFPGYVQLHRIAATRGPLDWADENPLRVRQLTDPIFVPHS
jgi:long-chain acyl-CoA synthetase